MTPSPPRPTKLRLALRLAAFSPDMATRAENGEFSDFESEHATPKMILVQELVRIEKTAINSERKKQARQLIEEVKDGKWDDTKEEAESWFAREGKDLLDV